MEQIEDTSFRADSKRIAKNTLLLYIRMGITMIVQLYTSRVILQSLGVTDYGIYNIVGTVVVMASFISNPLSSAIQRFYNFELGKQYDNNLNVVFNISFLIFVILACAIVVVMEPVGYWYVARKVNMPVERTNAALFAFHFSLFAFIVSLIRIPFESMILAHERMSFFAFLGIIEVILKLGNAFSLNWFGVDKLILFSLNLSLISVICFICVLVYSRHHFAAVKFRRVWDKHVFKSIMSFSGWSMFGSVASMSADQGVNVVVNYYCGVIVNAAVGVANQVSSAVNQFASNFQVAFRPQIVKLYAGNQFGSLRKMVINSSKYSFLLLFAIACPIVFNIDYLLKIWLVTVPEYASEFVVLNLVYLLMESLSAPLWMTVQATGVIKKYQLVISLFMLFNIIFSIVLLKHGLPPYYVLIIKCLLDVVYLGVRLVFVRRAIAFSISSFCRNVILPVAIISCVGVLFFFLLSFIHMSSLTRLLLGSSIFVVMYVPLVLFTCVSKSDRKIVFDFVKRRCGL